MKKNLFAIASVIIVAFALSNTANAQVLKTVAVSVTLNDVMSVGPDGTSGAAIVNFDYTTANDYNGEKTTTIPNQFSVMSTTGYNVVVKAGAATFVGVTPANTLPLSILKVSAKTSDGSTFGTAVVPTPVDQQLFTSSDATFNQSFDVNYTILKSAALLNAPKEKYTVNLIYSVAHL